MKKPDLPNNSEDAFDAIAKDPAVRRAVTRESHAMFFPVYLRHYVKYPMAEFQKDIIRITEDRENKLACIVAFRGSAKSTLITLSYAIWSVLGVQQKKFVLIVCQTQSQAKQHMTNLRRELEDNKLLKSDLGPFQEDAGGEWAASSIVFRNTGARIMVASLDQSVRGLRHHEHRPDLMILDDVEDLNSTKTSEGRNKTFDWFTREIVPLGDVGTSIVVVGNLLHEDSLMMRLRKKIENKEIDGIFRWYPLVDQDGKCLWPGKFDTPEKVEELRRKVANELAWQQEFLLNIVSDATRVIWPEWIQYYDAIEERPGETRTTYVGVDLAISQKETADCTAMVAVAQYGFGSKTRLYVLPNPVNARMTFPETIRTMAEMNGALKAASGNRPTFLVEANGFQSVYLDAATEKGCWVEGVKTVTDKRSRLAPIAYLIQQGKILFPRHGAEELVMQLLGFGMERHDDLCDALSLAVGKVIEEAPKERSLERWLDWVEKENNGSCWI